VAGFLALLEAFAFEFAARFENKAKKSGQITDIKTSPAQ